MLLQLIQSLDPQKVGFAVKDQIDPEKYRDRPIQRPNDGVMARMMRDIRVPLRAMQ